MIPGVITSQSGARQYDGKDMTKYSMFVGGVNATHHALANYSPVLNNFGRLFMVRPPKAILKMFAGDDKNLYSSDNLFIQFKHMLEYMNRSVTGFQDKTLEKAGTPIQGGFAGRQFSIPTVTKDPTTEVQIGLYEMTGLPVYTVLNMWINAIGDENSGLTTYGGWVSGGKDADGKEIRLYARQGESEFGYAPNEANHSAEFIYVQHDRSGAQVERAVLLANCWPTGVNQSTLLNGEATGSHDVVTYDITMNCTVYSSPLINAIASDLLKRYRIVSNSLNFNPELGDAVYAPNDVDLLQRTLGPVPVDSATGTRIGNLPAYDSVTAPNTVTVQNVNINDAKLSGQPEHDQKFSGVGGLAGISWDGFANN